MKILILTFALLLHFCGFALCLNSSDCLCKNYESSQTSNRPKNPSNIQDYSWSVNIRSMLDHENMTICQATVINEKGWLLTSATCTPNNEDELKFMKIQIRGDDELIDVEQVIRHPNYERNVTETEHDIALVKIKPFKFGPLIGPACFRTENNTRSLPKLSMLHLTVLGSETVVKFDPESGEISDFKPFNKSIETIVWNKATKFDEKCAKNATNDILCVRNNNKKERLSICLRDSGTPIHQMNYMKLYVVAIVSLPGPHIKNETIELCTNEVLTKTTNVSKYIDWISDHINSEYCS